MSEDDWRKREGATSPVAADELRERLRQAVESAQAELRRSEAPEAVEPYPLFLFDRRRALQIHRDQARGMTLLFQ